MMTDKQDLSNSLMENDILSNESQPKEDEGITRQETLVEETTEEKETDIVDIEIGHVDDESDTSSIISVDTSQRLTTTVSFILEFYKVLMGTFLVVFVPQSCGDDVCSLYENVTNTSGLHLAASIMNGCTFLVVTALYVIELMRENWAITYLDMDDDKPNNNLDDEIEHYPKLKTQMRKINTSYMISVNISIVMMTLNFILSGVSIGFDYVGMNTFTSILSFLLLVASKISTAYSTAHESLYEERIDSAYMKTAKTYNVIDEDHRIAFEDENSEEPQLRSKDKYIDIVLPDDNIEVNTDTEIIDKKRD